jgi:hypothetical protein
MKIQRKKVELRIKRKNLVKKLQSSKIRKELILVIILVINTTWLRKSEEKETKIKINLRKEEVEVAVEEVEEVYHVKKDLLSQKRRETIHSLI